MTKGGIPRAKLSTPKYGIKLRRRAEKVLARSRATYKCPNCGKIAVKRKFLGVWKCRKCGYEFAGGAWEPLTPLAAHTRRSLR